MEEEWRPIHNYSGVDYEGKYEVSNLGNIRSKKRGGMKILKPHTDGFRGYVTTVFSKNGKTQHIKIHRLVALHFLEKPEDKDRVDHIDGDRSNNRVSNLEWVNQAENSARFHVLRGSNAPIEILRGRLESIDAQIKKLESERELLSNKIDAQGTSVS